MIDITVGRIIEENPSIDVGGNICMSGSLTPENRRLLKETKIISRKKEYKYKRYKVNGQVRVSKNDKSEVIIVECIADLCKIVQHANFDGWLFFLLMLVFIVYNFVEQYTFYVDFNNIECIKCGTFFQSSRNILECSACKNKIPQKCSRLNKHEFSDNKKRKKNIFANSALITLVENAINTSTIDKLLLSALDVTR